jgi:hypothetical protein
MNVQNGPRKISPEVTETRRTVIPTPRPDGLFGGWGVKI